MPDDARRVRHERNPEDCGDPGLGCRRLQPARGADEDRTLSRLRGLRSDLIDPAIDAHHGRVVKRTGDGSIIEFRSVADHARRSRRVATNPSTRMLEREDL